MSSPTPTCERATLSSAESAAASSTRPAVPSAQPPQEPSPGALPPYIGFGTLDRRSITFGDGVLTAEYRHRVELMARVTWRSGECEYRQFLNGKTASWSSGVDLPGAVLQLTAAIVLTGKWSHWQWLRRRLGQRATVRSLRVSGTGLGSYPAVLMASLRVVNDLGIENASIVLPGFVRADGTLEPNWRVEPRLMPSYAYLRWHGRREIGRLAIAYLEYDLPAILVEPALGWLEARGCQRTEVELRPIVAAPFTRRRIECFA